MERQNYSLFKRGKVYYVAFYDNEGRRVYRSTGERSPVRADQEARRILGRGSLRDFARGFFSPSGEWVKAKLASGASLSPRYLHDKQAHLDNYILAKFGSWNIDAITAPHIRSWILSLELSLQTKKHIMQTFRDVLEEAVFHGSAERNEARLAGTITARHQERPAFTPEEMGKLFPEDDEQLIATWGNLFYASLFYLLASTGMRLSEALWLEWGNVHFDSGLLIVEGTKTQTSRRPALLTERAGRVLRRWQEAGTRREGLVFPGRVAGRPVREKSAWTRFRKVLGEKKIDRPGLVIHSLRHTFVTRLEDELPQKHLMLLTGHSTKAMLENYTHRELIEVGAALRVHSSRVSSAVFRAARSTSCDASDTRLLG